MALPRNNAFGADSPSWNLPFPNGNLTAAEILAYLPHWLKSVDVIDRFVTNGGRSASIAAIINEFRDMPTAEGWPANSAQIMMSYAMRRAGYKNWTVGIHARWQRATVLMEDDLHVSDFRTPCRTHPKSVRAREPQNVARNQEVEPIPFRNLALHVKQHPSGADALDLTRCVQYACEHEEEDWLFPTDFELLVFHLGGPARITQSHYDRQIFARHEVTSLSRTISTSRKRQRDNNNDITLRYQNMAHPYSGRALAHDMSRTQSITPGVTPQEQTEGGLGTVQRGSKRRSGRLVGKAVDFREDRDLEVSDHHDSQGAGYATPTKKRKLSRIPRTPGSPANDSDFVQDQSEPDEEVPEAEVGSDDQDLSFTPAPRGRAAARKARRIIQTSYVANQLPMIPKAQVYSRYLAKDSAKAIPTYMTTTFSPETMQAAREFEERVPVWLAPPVLSKDRYKIDGDTIFLYAAEGCLTMEAMWASALSSSRFGGPRRHPPFRELHRLSDPHPVDASDWAENIRWAKEQHRAFGSETWTEYDYHLECITAHRRKIMWVSEDLIKLTM